MPRQHSDKYKKLVKLLDENPVNIDYLNKNSFCRDDTKIISKDVLNRMKKENILYKLSNRLSFKHKSVIGDYVDNTICSYGSSSSSSSGWGSFPSSDSASFGGLGTEGAIQG